MAKKKKEAKPTRLDSKREADGAEFLVLGHLLIEGIQAFKAYVNFPGYDIVATNPEKKRACRIQVKSRWATDYDMGFPLKNTDCDFVVLVALNRGFRYTKKKLEAGEGRKEPQFYVFPIHVAKRARNLKDKWKKVQMRKINRLQKYQDNWMLVKGFLRMQRLEKR